LLALTFVRPSALLQGEWEEFDLDKALWTIPFKKLKQRNFREGIKELTGKPHFGPLSRQAVTLVRDLKKAHWQSTLCLSGSARRSPALDECVGSRTQEPWLSERSLPARLSLQRVNTA